MEEGTGFSSRKCLQMPTFNCCHTCIQIVLVFLLLFHFIFTVMIGVNIQMLLKYSFIEHFCFFYIMDL